MFALRPPSESPPRPYRLCIRERNGHSSKSAQGMRRGTRSCFALRTISSFGRDEQSLRSLSRPYDFSSQSVPSLSWSSSRSFFSTPVFNDEKKPAAADKKTVPIVFINKDGSKMEVNAVVGNSILEVAHANNIDLEGACEGSLACSTCHVILEPHWYEKLPSPVEEEEDMLDLAFGLTETSRLGCQIIVKEDMGGMVLKLPAATRNMSVDGFKPKPH